MPLKPATQMRPREILQARDATGCAFIPVSPMYEWHSWHLPMGCDGLIAEKVCALVAEEIGGIYFPTLPFGLDQFRPRRQLAQWGFAPDDKVFGMNFPELPLTSEYCEKPEMLAAVANRVSAAKSGGFRHVFIVNSHGGHGQTRTLKAFAKKHGCHFTTPGDMLDTRATDTPGVGGHAGMQETLLLMAFWPELVDLEEQEDGPLNVRKTGILHERPEVEAKWNPRNVDPQQARRIRESIVANMVTWARGIAGC